MGVNKIKSIYQVGTKRAIPVVGAALTFVLTGNPKPAGAQIEQAEAPMFDSGGDSKKIIYKTKSDKTVTMNFLDDGTTQLLDDRGNIIKTIKPKNIDGGSKKLSIFESDSINVNIENNVITFEIQGKESKNFQVKNNFGDYSVIDGTINGEHFISLTYLDDGDLISIYMSQDGNIIGKNLGKLPFLYTSVFSNEQLKDVDVNLKYFTIPYDGVPVIILQDKDYDIYMFVIDGDVYITKTKHGEEIPNDAKFIKQPRKDFPFSTNVEVGNAFDNNNNKKIEIPNSDFYINSTNQQK